MPIFEAKCGNIFYKSHDNAMKTCPGPQRAQTMKKMQSTDTDRYKTDN